MSIKDMNKDLAKIFITENIRNKVHITRRFVK